MTDLEESTHDVDGIHVVDVGPTDAAPIVWLGSLGSTTAMWAPQLDSFAGSYRCLAIDLPGHGRSAPPTGPVSIGDLAERVVRVLDHLAIERAAVIGLSIGGMTAMQLAAARPDRVSHLVALCTSALLGPASAWHERAATVRAGGTVAVADAVVGRWFTPEWAATHGDDVASMISMIASVDASGYAGCCEAIAAMDLRPLLGSIVARTLVIAGEHDPATPPDHGEAIADSIDRARLVVVPAAHLASWERADDVNAEIAAFLEER